MHKDKDVFDPRQYGPTLDEQMAQVRASADRASRQSAAEQEQVAQDLARRLQTTTSPAMKLELVRALAKLETQTAETSLRVSLADPDPLVRRTAVEAWGDRRSPQAISTLSRMLSSDTDIDVRLAAAAALGNYQDRAAVEALAVALDDPDPALQFRAIQSLEAVTGRDFGVNVVAWRNYIHGTQDIVTPPPSVARRWLDWF